VAVRAETTAATLPLADDWRAQAACRDSDIGLFDYDPDSDPEAKATAAKQICAGCQVRDACRDSALAQPAADDTIGIYGGLTPSERVELRDRNLQQRAKRARESWRLGADPRFARVTHELAAQIGVEAAASELGVHARTLQRAWQRHRLDPHAPIPPPRPEAARWLVAGALERLGWTEHDTARYWPITDPEFAASAFELAGKVGGFGAAEQLGTSTTTLYRAWDRHQLGRPERPQRWTQQLISDRALAERAFAHARQTSILATASEFQTSAPTLRRAFARHGLGHPHAGLDPAELRQRWHERPGPDHRNRQQRRAYRARLAAQRHHRREQAQQPPHDWRQRLAARARPDRGQEVGERER
jgi:WhiB family transcriptional regulator, redox-sensing transcriptional regulator